MSRTSLAPLLVSLLSLGCGRTVRPVVARAPDAPAPLCQMTGSWTSGELRTARGGYPFADVQEAHAEATVVREEGALRLYVILTRGGFHLEGRLDADEDDSLRVRAMTTLAEGVTLPPGSATHLVDARPLGGRRAELLVGLSRFALDEDDGVHFATPPQRWLPCEDLGFSFAYRDDETDGAERMALGFPAAPEDVRLPPGQAVVLSHVPGGPPFVQLGPIDQVRWLYQLEAQGGATRVLLHDWTGAMLVGWLETSALSAFDAGGGSADSLLLGSLGGGETLNVCVSPVPLDLYSERAGQVEPIGRLDAGARFVRDEVRAGGVFALRPHPEDGLGTSGDAVWIARSDAALTCTEERRDPLSAFGRGAPTTTLELALTTTAVTGLAGVAVGSACTVEVEHYPGMRLACRATIRCGETILFGDSTSNGYFECSVTAGATPSVSGRDPETSAGSGDAAVTIDAVQRTVIVEDDAAGANGAFRLEARIESIAERATE